MLIRFSLFFFLLTLSSAAEPSRKSDRYKVFLEGRLRPILWIFERNATEIDRDGDGILTLVELAATATKLPGRLSTDEDYAVNMLYEYAGLQAPYAKDYPNSSGVEAQVRRIAELEPHRVALRLLGSSVEGRPIWALRLGRTELSERPKVAIISGLHAREWIGPQVALTAARGLLENPENEDLLSGFEVWVLPLANPDGYDYSLSSQAMWRKNRRGVDLNRNFDADFRREGDTVQSHRDDWGGSDHPESPQFRGEQPASEPETQAVQKLLDLPGMVGVVDIHGFGNKIVLANSPTKVEDSTYLRLSAAMLSALGGDYEILRYEELYPITGHLGAYADRLGIPGVTLEVGRSFQPNPNKIENLSRQAVSGIVAYMRALLP